MQRRRDVVHCDRGEGRGVALLAHAGRHLQGLGAGRLEAGAARLAAAAGQPGCSKIRYIKSVTAPPRLTHVLIMSTPNDPRHILHSLVVNPTTSPPQAVHRACKVNNGKQGVQRPSRRAQGLPTLLISASTR